MEFISGYKTNYNLKDLHKILSGSKYYVYSYDDYQVLDREKCSDFYIYNLEEDVSQNFVKKFAEEIVIKSFSDKTLKEIQSFASFKLIFEQHSDNYTMLYGYSKKINEYVKIENLKVNIQIYISKDTIKIGSPLIFGYC